MFLAQKLISFLNGNTHTNDLLIFFSSTSLLFLTTAFPFLSRIALWTLEVKIKAGDAGPWNKNIGVAVNSEDVLLLFVRATGIRRMRIPFYKINISASSRESIKIKTQEITDVKYGSCVKERGKKFSIFFLVTTTITFQ